MTATEYRQPIDALPYGKRLPGALCDSTPSVSGVTPEVTHQVTPAVPKCDDFVIHVTHGRFTESSPQGRSLAAMDQKPLNFHEHVRIRPSAEHLAWHHKKHKIA